MPKGCLLDPAHTLSYCAAIAVYRCVTNIHITNTAVRIRLLSGRFKRVSNYTHPWHIRRAVQILRDGGVIAYPTEAVWGLGCDPWNRQAVSRLLSLKSRAVDKGVILACGDMSQLDFLLSSLTSAQYQKLSASWPGPYTWLVPDLFNRVPSWIKGNHKKVAVRVSEHSLIIELSAAFGRPIVSTSANPAGAPPALNALRVRQYFGDLLDYIVPGELGREQQPSRIMDLDSGVIIRN